MKNSEKWVTIVLIYLLMVIGGSFAIYLIQCAMNRYVIDYAEAVVADLEDDGFLENRDAYQPCSIFLYTDDGIRPVRKSYRQVDFDFTEYINKMPHHYSRDLHKYSVFGDVDPIAFVAEASKPYYHDDRYIGEIFVCHYLEQIPYILTLYMVVSTLLFVGVLTLFLQEAENHKKVENIYRRYVANISHELKTPIMSIQAMTETLNEGLASSEEMRSMYLGIISRESRKLERSVQQIIELSKLQDNKISYNKVYVPTQEFFEEIREIYEPRCEEIGIHFKIHESVYEVENIYTDADRLRELLEILLDNAYKFVEEDGHITISATRKHRTMTLRIEDDGRGISEEDLPHVFERFYKTNIKNPTGSGLGLAIAREIVNGLHEQMWVQSELGKYTIFFVTVSLHG